MAGENEKGWGTRPGIGISRCTRKVAGIALREENNVIGVFDTVKSVHVK